jgi:ribosomal protein L7/L12
MPTPVRACRWCGASEFIEAERIEWWIRAEQEPDARPQLGSLVACARCGLTEAFLAHPQALLGFAGAREVRAPSAPEGRAPIPTLSESPVGTGWQVVLVDAGPQPIGVISELRKELPISFASARAALERLPWVLTRTSNRRMAEAIVEKLVTMGAKARVEPSSV